ncbi:class I SAM-dependent methyltransferase [Fischerella sp. JS2]|uniref:class I SAM-dependent methyltransferase n=1 Tax=Fischerella sp. JS2 TaxID=2597771 RepID=UPI0028E291F4|nr:class I SAM-dependent methyltransferase [Fischerella sp. JS2]
MNPDILREQVEYYRQRASEYDEWFFRQGRYDRGEEHRQQWFFEVTEVETALRSAAPSGDILELACGTELWTQHLLPFATHLAAVDASPEAIALNQQRLGCASVEYIVADLFEWCSLQQFDFIFFGFWLSHVPMEKFVAFWQMVKQALKPDGRVFFVDSLLNQESTALNHAALHQQGYSQRKLNDGRTYRVVKIFHEPTKLEMSLQNLGWSGSIYRTANYFLYGLVYPAIAV